MQKLTPRLMTAVPFVRPGHLLADVGTDHAYLPIYLCQAGILTPVPVPPEAELPLPSGTERPAALCAVASDINQGPVDRATVHIRAAGLSGSILPLRTDGLHGLEAFRPRDILIFGMGGELIASILDAAPWVMSPGIRLVLQPMTHPEKLRAWLFDHGFRLVGETLSREESRIYQTVCAEYRPGEPLPDGARRPACLMTGTSYPAEQTALHLDLVRRTAATHTASRAARAGAGQDVSDEDALLADLAALEAGLTHE